MDEHLPPLLEGFVEIYYSTEGSKEFEWLLHLANESIGMIPEIELLKRFLPKSVIKYFLRIQLSKTTRQQVDDTNILSLYDNEVKYNY